MVGIRESLALSACLMHIVRMRWSGRRASAKPRRVKSRRIDKTYDSTALQLLGPAGARRLTPLAVWFAHDIAWRPLMERHGPVDGEVAVDYVQHLALRHGLSLEQVMAEGRHARQVPLTPPARALGRSRT